MLEDIENTMSVRREWTFQMFIMPIFLIEKLHCHNFICIHSMHCFNSFLFCLFQFTNLSDMWWGQICSWWIVVRLWELIKTLISWKTHLGQIFHNLFVFCCQPFRIFRYVAQHLHGKHYYIFNFNNFTHLHIAFTFHFLLTFNYNYLVTPN